MSFGERSLANPIKIYWDSCAWLGLVNGEPDKLPAVKAVYGQARQGLIEIWTSTMAVVEVNRLAAEMTMDKPIPPDGLSKIDNLLFQPFVNLINLDQIVAKRARKVIRETPGLKKRPDAVHLASAIVWNIPLFHTYDRDDLLHLNGSIHCMDGTAMEITAARDPFAGGLFDERPEIAG
jgi:predicted nucleic acid-binding protein